MDMQMMCGKPQAVCEEYKEGVCVRVGGGKTLL